MALFLFILAYKKTGLPLNTKMNCRVLILTIGLIVWSMAKGQSDLPEKPLISSVTIDTASGYTVIEWSAVGSSGIDHYNIYTLDISTSPVTGTYLATVPADSLRYTHDPAAGQPSYYTITAVDEGGNESLLGGDYHRPVNLEIKYDSCNSTMRLEWKRYVGWKHYLTGYRVFHKEASGQFVQLAQLDTNTRFFVQREIMENREYEYFVEAFDNRGSVSHSNISSHFTYMPPPPSYINLNHVTVLDDRTVEISFSADLSGVINDFLVSRGRETFGNFIPFDTLMNVTESTVLVYDEIPTQNSSYYYRVEALNSCMNTVALSNLGNNIFLKEGESEGSMIRLYWNPYEEFSTGLSDYTVFRANQYGEFEQVGTIFSGDTTFSEDIRQAGGEKISGAVEYYVEAQESGTNPLGYSESSRSNQLIVNVDTHILVPNAFSPNGDDRNNSFEPIMDFIPREYKMLIFDRSGKVLFQSNDPLKGWDGTMNGSTPMPEGVYIYHIEYQSYSGSRSDTTGHVTLVKPQ